MRVRFRPLEKHHGVWGASMIEAAWSGFGKGGLLHVRQAPPDKCVGVWFHGIRAEC